MKLKALIFAIGATLLAFGATPGSAMPVGPTPETSSVEKVWGGCGPYGHRGPWGGCRPGGQWGGGYYGPRPYYARPYYAPRPVYRPYRPYYRPYYRHW